MLEEQNDNRAEPLVLPSAAAWFVLRTNHYKEAVTQKRLESNGLFTYLPRLHQWPRPVVGADVGPMFPCYLFVRAAMPHDFRRVASTPGVRGFIANSNGPAPVDDTVIAFLRSRESADGVIRCDALPIGHDVRIVSGPLKGLVAIVQRRMPARERVAVLLHLLQRDTIVELPEHWIRRL